MTIEETAKALNLSTATIKRYWREARELLRKEIELTGRH